jgi:hypothetical protein
MARPRQRPSGSNQISWHTLAHARRESLSGEEDSLCSLSRALKRERVGVRVLEGTTSAELDRESE